jgi:hypothetical protein
VATWECKHGNIDLTIGQFGLCNLGGIGKKVKSTWQHSQIAMWTSCFGKVNLRNRTSEVGKIAQAMVFHTEAATNTSITRVFLFLNFVILKI